MESSHILRPVMCEYLYGGHSWLVSAGRGLWRRTAGDLQTSRPATWPIRPPYNLRHICLINALNGSCKQRQTIAMTIATPGVIWVMGSIVTNLTEDMPRKDYAPFAMPSSHPATPTHPYCNLQYASLISSHTSHATTPVGILARAP